MDRGGQTTKKTAAAGSSIPATYNAMKHDGGILSSEKGPPFQTPVFFFLFLLAEE